MAMAMGLLWKSKATDFDVTVGCSSDKSWCVFLINTPAGVVIGWRD
jgi:hypothetical protein